MATGNRLSTEIMINLAGNLTAKARQYGANMSQFARNHQKAMSLVKATTESATRGLDVLGNRYTAMIAGFAGSAMMREFAQVDRRMTRIGISAEKTREEMAQMLNGIQDAAIKFKVDDSELISAVEKVGTVTGEIDFGVKNKEMMAASIAASGSSGEAIGSLFSQFTKFGIKDELEALKAMDTLNLLGKEGAYELKDIAEKATRAMSLYSAAGGRGVQGVRDVGVVLESAIDATGDRDTAATVVENLIKDLQKTGTVKVLKHNGINVFDNEGNMRSLPLLLQEIAARSGSKGTEIQSQRLDEAGFLDDATMLIKAVTSGKGAENLQRYMKVTGDGKGIMKDSAYAAQDFTSAMQALETSWKKFSHHQLAKPVQDLADAINSVDQNTVQNWLQVGKYMAIAVGGIIAIRKTYQLGKTLHDIMNPKGKGKGIPGGITDVFGSGVMPVYVVNMGSGGMNGNTGGLPDTPDSSRNPRNPRGPGNRGGKAGKGAGIIAGALEFYDFLTTQYALPGEVDSLTKSVAGDASASQWEREFAQQSQDNQKALESVWRKVTDWFNSLGDKNIADPRPWAGMQPTQNYPFLSQQLQGEIRVVVEGDARVKSVRVDQPGVRLSAQAGVTSVEQG
ncbi:phage tail tape measure protein [Escherichia coli]|uniref:phage tail tape measure protein n=1 Tax=Escherichia coli TaxID=562 RepID=UPI001E157130|nr:phage tail tape measure protein [Escherichia coli]EHS3288530.1 phage tail tape measure protein [Escherichia coli]EHS3293769.1 phage tail tape measure protein [Escherichia coli]EHS3308996.1 phage tail tape measure protein [Escherichia coli]EHS3324341.1 phage tail tape measure protein [Escherichia coli]EHS3329489.1 phage tail tape measure protein [Escherichia coli]